MALHGEVPMPDYQVLFYPVTDMAGNPPSYDRFTEGLVLTRDVMKWFIAHYLGPHEKGIDWRASPLRAPSLKGLPPAFLMTAGIDPLVDEGIAYAKRLDEEGVNVTHLHVADQIHACLTMGRFIPKSDLVLQHAAASLRAHWGS
jgi:acetyl esterase